MASRQAGSHLTAVPSHLGHGTVSAVRTDDGAGRAAGSRWWIGLDSWVLQDGNYTDFVVGQRRQFALEFGYRRSARLQLTDARQRRCVHTGRDMTYAVTAELVRAPRQRELNAFVLDFGLRAYDDWMVLDDLEPPPPDVWLEGEISLHVDHFSFMDELAAVPGMPSLIYTWRIDAIQVDTSPRIWIDASHPDYVGPDEGPSPVPDPDRESWRSVRRTRTWDHGGGYRLLCTLLDETPVSTMAASGVRSPYGPLRTSPLRLPGRGRAGRTRSRRAWGLVAAGGGDMSSAGLPDPLVIADDGDERAAQEPRSSALRGSVATMRWRLRSRGSRRWPRLRWRALRLRYSSTSGPG